MNFASKKLKPLLFGALAAVFALTLCACSSASSDGGSATASSAFVGTWDLYEITSEDEDAVTTHDSVESLKENNQLMFVNLNEDGTAQFLQFSTSLDGSWESTGDNTATLTIENQTYELSISDDGKMSYVEGDRTWVYEHGDAKNVDDYVVKTVDEVIDESFQPITIADDDTCKAVAKKCYSDQYGDPGYKIVITNKSSKSIYFTTADMFTVDGQEAALSGSTELKPGKKESVFFYFKKELVDGIDALKNVTGKFMAVSGEDGSTIAEYDFSDE